MQHKIKMVKPTNQIPHGVKYSLRLHDKNNTRILGFGNARSIEAKVWFESIETMSQVLSTKNVELLKLIERKRPQFISDYRRYVCVNVALFLY